MIQNLYVKMFQFQPCYNPIIILLSPQQEAGKTSRCHAGRDTPELHNGLGAIFFEEQRWRLCRGVVVVYFFSPKVPKVPKMEESSPL